MKKTRPFSVCFFSGKTAIYCDFLRKKFFCRIVGRTAGLRVVSAKMGLRNTGKQKTADMGRLLPAESVKGTGAAYEVAGIRKALEKIAFGAPNPLPDGEKIGLVVRNS